jgi:hypothetical protein
MSQYYYFTAVPFVFISLNMFLQKMVGGQNKVLQITDIKSKIKMLQIVAGSTTIFSKSSLIIFAETSVKYTMN